MKCPQCNINMKSGTKTHTVQHPAGTMIFHHVPCFECLSCGQSFFSPEITRNLENKIDNLSEVLSGVYETEFDPVNP